ncbi:Fic family protein [Enterobacter cloacae]|mgnify:FL=1|jgi:Fic family protein|uniref:Fic family protein n=1 Tax=Enterobacter cloacae TaxID=550 RepID=UPI00062C8924|nr:Fic family protein [Enterobacter cloacae]ELE9014604.1 Fic family protein [Enterobacter cloacae]KKY86908.1 cell division protein Fic [Enterobacter cloacae]KZQ36264.1 cell filamentation protein Fic [Enterobacter cloacae subsp. dissolvens]MDR9932057.1 Fic family protein [Enterobacter cloacae subsp. dissolvens]MEA5213581.1 Fic family protein [Enterobacter cloacae]
MSRYQPPFTITPSILNQVVEIGELLGHWAAHSGRNSPLLRKENRIRTIQASLAIEHNSLTTGQVTAIMEGKRVLAPEKDIQEVRNAILAYEKLPEWKPWTLKDLLSAHRLLMLGLVDNPGKLRMGDVGVYRGNQLVHMAPPASQINRLIADLLVWLKETELHPLITSSVFHYEFEFIHPFSDGNGRMGRLWQTLILSQWRSELAWLPVETLIHFQQDRYYQILGECDRASDCTAFIEFMLQNMAEALREGIGAPSVMSEKMSEEMSEKETTILELLTVQPQMSAAMLASMLGVTSRTVERYLSALQTKGKLKRLGARKGGSWQVMP